MTNVFDQFDQPAGQPNVFDQFDQTKSAPSSSAVAPPSSATAPSSSSSAGGESWGDWLHRLATQSSLSDATRAAQDAMSFGLVDKAMSYLPGGGQAAADTTAARQRLGNWSILPEMAGYAAGPGEIGAAEKVGGALAPYAGKWLGGVLGSAAEGTGASALGAVGHGDDIGASALTGGAVGAVGGALGGVVGRGGTLAPAKTAEQLKGEAQPLLNALDATPIPNQATNQAIGQARANVAAAFPNKSSKDIDRALAPLDQLETDIWGGTMNAKAVQNQLRGMPPQVQAQIMAQAGIPATASAGRIDSAITALKGQGEIGNQAATALDNLMSTTPAVHPSGASTNAAALADEGKTLWGRYLDTNRLGDWQAEAAVKGGPDIGGQARSYLLSDAGKRFAPPGSPQYDALNTLAGTAKGPLGATGQGLTFWDIKHHLMWPLVGLGVGQAAGALGAGGGQQSPWMMLPEDIAGLGAGLLLKNRLAARSALVQQRALDAARTALSTGQAQAPITPAPAFRDALRNLVYSQGASGAPRGLWPWQ